MRSIERRYVLQDPDSEQALLLARVRSGQAPLQLLSLLTLFGHDLASSLTCVPRLDLAAPSSTAALRLCKRVVRGAGKRATLSAVAAGVRVFLDDHRRDAVRDQIAVLDAVDAWCAKPSPAAREGVLAALNPLLERALGPHWADPSPRLLAEAVLRPAFEVPAITALRWAATPARRYEQRVMVAARTCLLARIL